MTTSTELSVVDNAGEGRYEARVAENKPFCDGSHRRIGFTTA